MNNESGESMEPREKSVTLRTRWIRIGEISTQLTERSRELIPETK